MLIGIIRKKGKLMMQNEEETFAGTTVLRYGRRVGSGKEGEIRKGLRQKQGHFSIMTGVQVDTMHPGAHNCTEVVLAEYRNSHLIAPIFCHDLKMELEDLVIEVYKERKMYE